MTDQASDSSKKQLLRTDKRRGPINRRKMDAEKKIRAWQSTDNNVARFKAGISGHGKGEQHYFGKAIREWTS